MYKFGKTALALLALATMSFGVMTACDDGDQPHTGWEPQSSSSSLVTDSSSSVEDVGSSSSSTMTEERVAYTITNMEKFNGSEGDSGSLVLNIDGTYVLELLSPAFEMKIWNDGTYTKEGTAVRLTPMGARAEIGGVELEYSKEDGDGFYLVKGTLDETNKTCIVTYVTVGGAWMEAGTYTVTNPDYLECDEAMLVIRDDNTFSLTCVESIRIAGDCSMSDDEVYLQTTRVWWWMDTEWVEAEEEDLGAFAVWGLLNTEDQTFTVTDAGEDEDSSGGEIGDNPTTFHYQAVNPELLGLQQMTMTIWTDGRFEACMELFIGHGNYIVCLDGSYTVTDDVYHFDTTHVEPLHTSTSIMNGDVESSETVWDFYGMVDKQTQELTLTAPGTNIETQWDREIFVLNPDNMNAQFINIHFYTDGTFTYIAQIPMDEESCYEATVNGVYSITNGIYFLDGRYVKATNGDQVIRDEDMEPDALMFDLYGEYDYVYGVFYITDGGATENPNRGYISLNATNPEQLSGERIQVEMWNDGSYTLIVEVNTPDGLARMIITGVWMEWADGTIHFDALTAVQDYKGETTEDTSEDKKHWDVYGTLDRENGTFTITGKGSTPPGNNGTQGGDVPTDDNGQGGNNGTQGDDGLADEDTPPSNNN